MLYKQSAQSGVPPLPSIGGGRFGWKFKAGGPDPTLARAWFVDGNVGSDAYDGADPETAFATVGKAISKAAAYDVIYVLDKGLSGTDPNPYQEAVANLSIPYAKNNLALIGVPHNIHQVYGLQIKNLSDATTTPVLTVKAPFCAIENLDFNKGGLGVGSCISLLDDGNTTNQAQGTSVYNCHLRNSARGSAARTVAGGILIDGGYYYTIKDCFFMDNTTGVYMKSGVSVIKGIQILGCTFNGTLVNLDTDIYTSGTSYNLLVDRCNFAHAACAFAGAGALTAYIYDLVTSVIMVSNSVFAHANATCKNTGAEDIVLAALGSIVNCHDADAAKILWA